MFLEITLNWTKGKVYQVIFREKVWCPLKSFRAPTPMVDPNTKQGAIYQIPCHDNDFSYIGETKRRFFIRKKEHSADIRHLRFGKSVLTKHVFDNEHSMDWTKAKILDFELDFTKCHFVESYFINQIPDTMNDKQNDKFPTIYLATLL